MIPDITITTIDPGKVTGVAQLYKGEIKTYHFDTWVRLDDFVRSSNLVIYEMPFMKATTDPIVFEVKGAVLECCYRNKVAVLSQAASVPSFIETAFADLWVSPLVKSKLIHERDALAHLVKYLVVTKRYLTEEEICKIIV